MLKGESKFIIVQDINQLCGLVNLGLKQAIGNQTFSNQSYLNRLPIDTDELEDDYLLDLAIEVHKKTEFMDNN
jgi:hypothetical protein